MTMMRWALTPMRVATRGIADMIIPACYREEIAQLEDKIADGFASEKDELRLQEIWRNIIENENCKGE